MAIHGAQRVTNGFISRVMRATSERNRKFLASWWAVCLAQECYNRDNGGCDCTNSGYDGRIKQATVTSVLVDKTALFQEELTLMGYLKTIVTLFYITFIHKRREGAYRELYCIVEDVTLPDESFFADELQSGI